MIEACVDAFDTVASPSIVDSVSNCRLVVILVSWFGLTLVIRVTPGVRPYV